MTLGILKTYLTNGRSLNNLYTIRQRATETQVQIRVINKSDNGKSSFKIKTLKAAAGKKCIRYINKLLLPILVRMIKKRPFRK